MTICAVALVDAMPSNRTSIGTALNDTAQEVGSSVGTAIVGTLIAALVTTTLPAGTWSHDLVQSFFHGERITFAVLAVVVGLMAGVGALLAHQLPLHRGAGAGLRISSRRPSRGLGSRRRRRPGTVPGRRRRSGPVPGR